MPEPKIDPLTWPYRWGLTWIVAAAVALAIDGALYVWWRPGFDFFDDALIIAAWLCLGRAAYWRGYRNGYTRSWIDARTVRSLVDHPGSSGVAVKP